MNKLKWLFPAIMVRMLCLRVGEVGLERSHPLLHTVPVDSGSWLKEIKLTAEALALLFKMHSGRLAEDDAVDGAGC